MDDPDFVRQLDGVNDAKRVASKRLRDLEDAGAEAVQGFRDARFSTLGRDL